MNALSPSPTKLDSRIEAFCSQTADAVFSTVVHPGSVWRRDLFDVETIHADARATFTQLLNRATADERPPYGKIFLIRGTSGSGKTHLLRAYRGYTHDAGGYAGYLQMISQSGDYTRYLLAYLIDSLDQPYLDHVGSAPALLRLAQGVLDSITAASAEEKEELCSAVLDSPGIVKQVELLANFAIQEGTYDDRDLDIIRALLFLLSTDRRLKSRVMKWLRCEELTPADRELLGGLVAPNMDGASLRMIAGLGRITNYLGSALVLLVDQLEETFDISVEEQESGRRFRQAVDALVNVAAHVPNAVVVVACLDHYYEVNRQRLPEPKLHRLELETPPVTLRAQRDHNEVADILEQRLRELCERCECSFDADDPLFPFQRDQLQPLAGQTIRKILLDFHQHHRRCRERDEWVDPDWVKPEKTGGGDDNGNGKDKDTKAVTWAQRWNDHLGGSNTPILDDEAELAQLLTFAIAAVSNEMPNGIRFSVDRDERFMEVLIDTGNGADKRLVAICDRNARGGGLKKQVEATIKRGGEIPTVLVRSTPFPNNPTANIAQLLAKHLAPRGRARKVVVSDSDWRALAAFRTFHQQFQAQSGYREWQRSSRPLSALASVSTVLNLDQLEAAAPQPLPPAPPLPPAGRAKAPEPPAPTPTPPPPPPVTTAVRFAVTRGTLSAPVELEPKSLCRHAAFLGGSGSGKTTAALAIIEELLLAGVPAVLLDRKGDLAQYADPAAWSAPEPDADRAARRARLRAAIDVRLYTPGANEGRPLAISVVPPGLGAAPASEREQLAQYAAAGLGQMMGYRSRGIDPKLVILQKSIEVLAGVGSAVTVDALQKLVSDQDDALLVEFDGQYEERHFRTLRQDLYSLGARHRRLFEAPEALDVDALLGRGAFAVPGRTRLTVLSTGALGDAATTDFWVSQLLLALDQWRSRHPAPGGELQAVFLFDEADAYLPAVGKPATKGPMESLLRRARSAGLGLFLATQSPGDFDYKCRDQITTWLVGQVKQTVAIEKLKPVLQSKPGAADKLAEQKAGEFWLVRESDVRAIQATRNLIPTHQLSEDRILELARTSRPAGTV